MPEPILSLMSATYRLVEVTKIEITPAVQDEANEGRWVREVRVFGPKPDNTAGVGPLVFVLRTEAETEADIRVMTPELTF